MAEITVHEVEGMRQVRMDIAGEEVRAAAGALSNLRGDIEMTASLPRPGEFIASLLTSEARIRPRFRGTGSIVLQPSLGGFHILDVAGERWLLEPGAYHASTGDVRLGLHRERFWPGLWAGDGMFKILTSVTGHGRIAINAPGPVELVSVENAELRVQGRLVLGHTAGLRFYSRHATTWLQSFISGQERLRVYVGTGQALVCWTPYWNQYLYERVIGSNATTSFAFE